MRELARHIQDMRKDAGYSPTDKAVATFSGDDYIVKLALRWKDFISGEISATSLRFSQEKRRSDIEKIIPFRGADLVVKLKK